jgi:hypothetical protein
MNPKTIDHVCSRLVYAFHWRNVGSKVRINEMLALRYCRRFAPSCVNSILEVNLNRVAARSFGCDDARTRGLPVLVPDFATVSESWQQ